MTPITKIFRWKVTIWGPTEASIALSNARGEFYRGQHADMILVPRPATTCARCWKNSIPHNLEHLTRYDGRPNIAGSIFGLVAYLKVVYCEHFDRSGTRMRAPSADYSLKLIGDDWYLVLPPTQQESL